MNPKLLISDIYKLLIGSGYNLTIGQDAPAGSGVMKRWDGAQWVEIPLVQYWDTAWDENIGVKYYNGTGWVQLN